MKYLNTYMNSSAQESIPGKVREKDKLSTEASKCKVNCSDLRPFKQICVSPFPTDAKFSILTKRAAVLTHVVLRGQI